ncbi:MAG TPA: tetratricopeptide repeat protein [Chitinophagaceae bacterium]|nr:tetratricopeptide repeat protein [Chitinophagaceae bacterium]
MRKYIFLLFTGLLVMASLQSQDYYKKINNALRYIKLGNTLREAQQYDLSEKYLRQGLQMITEQGDKYWEAATYENLGLLYKDQDKPEDAARYFNKALTLYRQLKMSLSEKALEQMLTGAEGREQNYAGIEIGAKGVKLSILGIQLNSSGEVEYILKADSSVNPEPAVLSPQSQQETADAVKKFIGIASSRYGIPPEKTYVVISSGLKSELDKKDKAAEFIKNITPSGAAAAIAIHSVSSAEEAELAVLGTVPPKRRYSTSLIDVGSTKTNGGYFMDASQSFDAVYFPVGTKSFVSMVKNKNPFNINEFARYAENLFRDSLSRIVRDELSRRAGLRNRSATYLGGGIVWCIATYLYPEKCNDNYVELTQEDIRRFRNMLLTNYLKTIQPDISNITNERLMMDARKTISLAQNTYDQESLLAGAVWIDGLMKELNATQPTKRFFFSKYAYVGWISGYISRAVAEDFKRKTEQ